MIMVLVLFVLLVNDLEKRLQQFVVVSVIVSLKQMTHRAPRPFYYCAEYFGQYSQCIDVKSLIFVWVMLLCIIQKINERLFQFTQTVLC